MKTKLFTIALAATCGIMLIHRSSMKSVNKPAESSEGTVKSFSCERPTDQIQLGFSSYLDVLTPVYKNISKNRLSGFVAKKNDPTKAKGMKAYPNPANDEVNIDLTLTDRSDITLRMMDLTGKDIFIKFVKEVGKGDHVFTLQTKAFEAGHYIVTATKQNNQPIGTIKLVIRH
jgi:uncharacterized protein